MHLVLHCRLSGVGQSQKGRGNKKREEKKKEKYGYSALGGANNYKWPQAGRWVQCRGAPQPWPLVKVAGDMHTSVCTHRGTRCLSPHWAPRHPISASRGSRGSTRALPGSAGPQQTPRAEGCPGRAPHPAQPSLGDRRDLPRLLPAREARAAPRLMQPQCNRGWQGCAGDPAGMHWSSHRDAVELPQGCAGAPAGMRWSSGRVDSTGRSCRGQHGIVPPSIASIQCPHRTSPQPCPIYTSSPPGCSPLSRPR